MTTRIIPSEQSRSALLKRADDIVISGYSLARSAAEDLRKPERQRLATAWWIVDALHYVPAVVQSAREDPASIDWAWLERDVRNFETHRENRFETVDLSDFLADCRAGQRIRRNDGKGLLSSIRNRLFGVLSQESA